MIKLNWELFLLVFLWEILDQHSVFIENSVTVVHDSPSDLWIEPADEIIEFLPEEISHAFTLIE